MYFYVYRLTCVLPEADTGAKYYYGVRSSHVPPEEDRSYLSSSRPIRALIRQHGAASFQKKIRRVFDTFEAAQAYEAVLHAHFDVKNHARFFNQSNATASYDGGYRFTNAGQPHTEATKQRIGAANRGRVPSDESRARMSAAQRGRKTTSATRQKLSQAQRERVVTNRMRESFEHHTQRRVQCPHCDKAGPRGVMLQWHFDYCPQNPQAKKREGVHCPHCDKWFARQNELDNLHLQQCPKNPQRTEVTNPPLVCPHCGMTRPDSLSHRRAMQRWHFNRCKKRPPDARK